MCTWRNLADFLGLRRNTTLLLVALVLAGSGERLWLGFVPKYLETLGATVFIIALFDALQTLLGAIYAYPGGWLTDRWGQRRSLLAFSVLSLAGYFIVLLWHHWIAVVLGAFLFLAWTAFSLPATFTIVATTLGREQQTMGVGVQSMMRRVPMIAGPLVGGWLISHFGWQHGTQLALLCCLILGTISLPFQWFIVDSKVVVVASPGMKSAVGASLFAVVKSFNPTLRELLVSDILIRFCERIPYTFVILWAINHSGIDAQQFGILTAIEMATAMVCYIPVAHLADKYGQRPFVLVTFIFFTLFPIFLSFAGSFGWLALAFIVRGLKEFGEPARKAFIIAQARPGLRARTYGAYYLIRDSVVTTGSFLGAVLWSISPQANFIGAALSGLAGTLWFWWFIARRSADSLPSNAAPMREN